MTEVERSKSSETYSIVGTLERAIDQVDRMLAQEKGEGDLTLDFSGCTFISVDGLEWLEELLMRADSRKAKVVFVNIPPTIYKVFKVAHIDSLLRACGAPGHIGSVC